MCFSPLCFCSTKKVRIKDTFIQHLLKEYVLIDDSSLIDYNHFWYNNELWSFIGPSIGSQKSGDLQDIKIGGYALTSVGKELFQITKSEPPPDYFEKITDYLQDLYSIKLYNMSKHSQNASNT